MPLRLATLFAAQLFDLGTFVTMIAWHGPTAEANPLVADLLISIGLPALIVAKAFLIVLVGSLLVAATAHGRRGAWSIVGGLPLALAIAFGLIGGITNAATILG